MFKYISSFFGWIVAVRERMHEADRQSWRENPDPRSRSFID